MKKTTLIKATGQIRWTVCEDRVDTDHETLIDDARNVELLLSFVQPAREDDAGTAYFAHAPRATDLGKAVAMTKMQRGRYNEGLDILDEQDAAYGSALGLAMYSASHVGDQDVLVIADDLSRARMYKDTLHLTRTVVFVDVMLGHFAKSRRPPGHDGLRADRHTPRGSVPV